MLPSFLLTILPLLTSWSHWLPQNGWWGRNASAPFSFVRKQKCTRILFFKMMMMRFSECYLGDSLYCIYQNKPAPYTLLSSLDTGRNWGSERWSNLPWIPLFSLFSCKASVWSYQLWDEKCGTEAKDIKLIATGFLVAIWDLRVPEVIDSIDWIPHGRGLKAQHNRPIKLGWLSLRYF